MKLVSLYILLVPAMVLVLTGVAVVLDSSHRSSTRATRTLGCCTRSPGREQQRQRVRGIEREHDLLRDRTRDADRAVRLDRWCWLARRLTRRTQRQGTFPTTSPLFVGLVIGVIVIVAALTYFPALSLGPLVEGLVDVRRQVALAVAPRCSPEARPAPDVAQPRHVRGRVRLGSDDGPVRPRPCALRRVGSPGGGSPWSSPTSQRRWRRAGQGAGGRAAGHPYRDDRPTSIGGRRGTGARAARPRRPRWSSRPVR